MFLNSLPIDKFSGWSKLKAFADNKINVTEKLKFILGRVQNIVGKGENDGYQHFQLFPTMFSKGFFFKVVKSWDCVVNPFPNKPWFLRVCSTSLLKTLWEKENLLSVF